MKKGRTNSSFKKVSTRVAILALGVGLGISLLVSGGTFAKWTASISQMTGANIQIGDWVAVEPPVISTDPRLPDANVGAEYRHQLEASFSEKATWSYQHVSGSLPTGMTLSREGVISGTPTYASTYTFRAIVKNIAGSDVRSFTLVTHPVAPVFADSQVLPDAFDGRGYPNTTLTASGQSRAYAITSGTLPKGLILHANGLITGTPVGYGVFTFTVTVSNGGGSDSKEFTINLDSDFPYITTTALPDATKGVAYGQTIAGSGPSPTYSIVSGSLPNGLMLSPTTGRISGTSNTQGLSEFTVSKTNAMGATTQDLSIYVRYAAPTFTSYYNPPTVRKNVAYSYQLVGTGEGVTYTVTKGSLPEGITLNATTGVISGTTSMIGDFDLTITKTNESGEASKSFTLTSLLVAPTLSFPSWVDYGRVDSYLQITPKSTGEEVVWSSPDLPTGLSIDPVTGVISGTPTVVLNKYAVITVTNSGGFASSNQFFIIQAKLPVIATTSFPEGRIGEAYLSEKVETEEGVTYSLVGTIPPGLTIDKNTGVLSGNPTQSGNFTNVILRATNTGGSVDKALSVVIKEDVPTITTETLDRLMQGVPYSKPLAGAGVNSKYAITAGALPPGMSLVVSNGNISGTPYSAAHGSYTFTVTKTNTEGSVSREFTLNVVYQTPTFTSGTAIPQGTIDRAYSYTFPGLGNGSTYTITKGSLPAGVTLNPETGVISGTLTVEGDFAFTVQKTNESGSVSKDHTMKVVHLAPTTKQTGFPPAVVGVPYSSKLNVTGLGLTYSIIYGKLPAGITLDPQTGIISGTATEAAIIYVQIEVSNSGGKANIWNNFSVNELPPTMVTTSLPSGITGDPYLAQIEAVGKGITYSSDTLPWGVTLNSTTGVISGTPGSPFSGNVTFTIRNLGNQVSRTMKMNIVTQAPTITTETFPRGTAGYRYEQNITGAGFYNTFSISAGELPPGLFLGAANGSLTGVLSQTNTHGNYTFTVTKTNASGTVSKEFTINVIYSSPTFTTPAGALSSANVGQNYSVPITGTATHVTHSISAGELPPGLSIDKAGLIAGQPTVAGKYTFTVSKSNLDWEVFREFSITVLPGTATASVANVTEGLLLLRHFRE